MSAEKNTSFDAFFIETPRHITFDVVIT